MTILRISGPNTNALPLLVIRLRNCRVLWKAIQSRIFPSMLAQWAQTYMVLVATLLDGFFKWLHHDNIMICLDTMISKDVLANIFEK